ncbi:MAG: DUF4860 domain-containing protein [Oscillospiraceae bacterium]
MNRPDSKRLAETVSSAASMTLFMLFAVCCLVMTAVAASAYKRINENYDNTFNSAAVVRYITNKLRACESAEVLSETELLLTGDGFKTLIYCRDGELYERAFAEESEISANGGEQLFHVEQFSLTEKNGLVEISTSDGSGEALKTCCRIENGGDGNGQSDQG